MAVEQVRLHLKKRLKRMEPQQQQQHQQKKESMAAVAFQLVWPVTQKAWRKFQRNNGINSSIGNSSCRVRLKHFLQHTFGENVVLPYSMKPNPLIPT